MRGLVFLAAKARWGARRIAAMCGAVDRPWGRSAAGNHPASILRFASHARRVDTHRRGVFAPAHARAVADHLSPPPFNSFPVKQQG